MNLMCHQEGTLDMQYVQEVMIGQGDFTMPQYGSPTGSSDPFELVEEYIKEELKQEQMPRSCNTDSLHQYCGIQAAYGGPCYSASNSPHHYSDSGFSSEESCDPPSPMARSPMWSNGSIPSGYPNMQQESILAPSPQHDVAPVSESSFQPLQPEHSCPVSSNDPWLNPAEFCDINDIGNLVPKTEILEGQSSNYCSVISFPSAEVVVGWKDKKLNIQASQDRCLDFSPSLCHRESLSSPEPSLSEDEGSPEPVDIRMHHMHIPTKKLNSRNRHDKGPVRKGLQLWQFLLEVLQDERYNPDLIRWVNPDQGIFKFVQSQKVAKLWGQKRAKSNMSYEYLSRALRYYYSRGIMRRITGKRLVYQFGPNAYGWENSCPINQRKRVQHV